MRSSPRARRGAGGTRQRRACTTGAALDGGRGSHVVVIQSFNDFLFCFFSGFPPRALKNLDVPHARNALCRNMRFSPISGAYDRFFTIMTVCRVGERGFRLTICVLREGSGQTLPQTPTWWRAAETRGRRRPRRPGRPRPRSLRSPRNKPPRRTRARGLPRLATPRGSRPLLQTRADSPQMRMPPLPARPRPRLRPARLPRGRRPRVRLRARGWACPARAWRRPRRTACVRTAVDRTGTTVASAEERESVSTTASAPSAATAGVRRCASTTGSGTSARSAAGRAYASTSACVTSARTAAGAPSATTSAYARIVRIARGRRFARIAA